MPDRLCRTVHRDSFSLPIYAAAAGRRGRMPAATSIVLPRTGLTESSVPVFFDIGSESNVCPVDVVVNGLWQADDVQPLF